MSSSPLSPPYPVPSFQRSVFLFAAVAIIGVGVFHAYVYRWLCDDIFITFRYIDQWFAGNGLVYNAGERVEGYTHPLWLLILAGTRVVGLDMVGASMWLGLVLHGILLATLAVVSWRSTTSGSYPMPAAAAAVALHYDASVWATSGLETALFSLLVTASLATFSYWKGDAARGRFVTGALSVLAFLTRPDGMLLIVGLGAMAVISDRVLDLPQHERRRRLLAFTLPAAILVPYALWKVIYYGALLPNTYYAKSGGGSYFSQGWTYIASYLTAYPSSYLLLLGPVALWYAGFGRREDVSSGDRSAVRNVIRVCTADPSRMFISAATLFVGLYVVLFVARVGGDFMYARFLIPLVPITYFVIELSVRRLVQNHARVMLVALLTLPIIVGTLDASSRDAAFTRNDAGEYVLRGTANGIVDEHYFWTRPFTENGRNSLEMLADVGRRLSSYFDGLEVRIIIRGQASLAYYSHASLVIENWGLTDAFIAHMEMNGRGRVGHEKSAPLEYVLARRVHFFFFKTYTPLDTSYYRIVRFNLPHDWSLADMHYYDRDLMRAFKERFPDDIHFVDFEAYLDQYLGGIGSRTREEVERDFAAFRTFYFYHNADPIREKRFLEELLKK